MYIAIITKYKKGQSCHGDDSLFIIILNYQKSENILTFIFLFQKKVLYLHYTIKHNNYMETLTKEKTKNQLERAQTILYLMICETKRLEAIIPEIEELVLDAYCSDLNGYIDYAQECPEAVLEYAIEIHLDFHKAIAKFIKNY